MNRVCLDANIWIKVLTEEPDTILAEQLIMRLLRERMDIIAPSMMKMEVGSILRKKWSKGLLSYDQLNALWYHYLKLPIEYIGHPRVFDEAWQIADMNGLVHTYDAIYISLCDGIEFWTTDERLVNSITKTNAIIKLLKHFH
jgi:predicted nucleic acid-binding protein